MVRIICLASLRRTDYLLDVRIHRLADIHKLINEAPGGNKTLPESAPVQTISLPARPVWVK